MTTIRIVESLLCFAFGGFLAYCDITPFNWRFYVLLAIFIGYGVANHIRGGG